MKAPRLKKLARLLTTLAVIPLAIPGPFTALGAEPTLRRGKAAPSTTTPSKAEARCKLNFFRKSWDEVLQQVADETGSTLVMPETPPGQFSRTDFEKHTREDAVRILNRDLEKLGFRLVAKESVLELISTKKDQPEYRRHAVQPDRSGQPALPLNAVTAAPDKTPVIPPQQTVMPASHETPAGNEITPATKAAPPKVVSSTIRPEHRPALDLAKQLHATFKQRSKLENAGPTGLPAFVVEHFDPVMIEARQPLFILEIDTTGNQLIVTAPETVQSGIQQLIKRLDTNPLGAEEMPRLVAGSGRTAELGEKLSAPLSLIAQAREKEGTAPPPEDGEKPTDLPPSPPASGLPGAPSGVPGTAVPLPALLGNLKGDVSIEALNDLDLLILRGNEKDVEAVMQVIRAIEQMAVGSLPEIHLLRLQFVDSQSLSQLLNDVYTRMTELRTNNAQQSQVSVRVLPVVVPNAVLVMAPANAIEAVLSLAEELDRPVDPTHEVHIFRLKYAVATSVSEMLTNFYTQPPVGLGTRIKVSADFRSNSIVVQANPRDISEIAEFIKGVDTEQASSVARMQIFPLKSAVAQELSDFMNNAIQGVLNPARMTTTGAGGQGQAQGNTANQQAKAAVLEFLKDGSTELIRSGLLNDIRFNADPRTNSLMVTASEQSMPLVEELIRMLDRPSTAISEIKVFPLRNADASSAATLLQELFSTTGGTQGNQQNRTNQGALGIELAGAVGSGSNLIPLRFSVDSRTNSVVAIGGADALRIVEAILYKLDTNDARNRQTTVIKLRNSPVQDVATAINEFLQAQRDLATLDPDRISTSQLLEQEIIVTAEPVTNSLLISATPAYFKQLEEIAKRLDAEPPQVVIQAMLVEVTLDNTDEFGVELGLQDPVLFARSAISDLVTTTTTTAVPGVGNVQTTNVISQQAIPGFAFNNQPLGNNNSNGATNGTVGGQGISNFAVGRTNNDLGYGGMVLSASSESVSVLIRALATRRTVRVLSRPQVIALDNQTAEIQVGQVVPVPIGTTITNGIAQTTVDPDPVGIILSVIPRISPEGQIVMEVAAEKSAYPSLTTGVPIATDGNGNIVYSPVKEITTARTTVKVPDGQTVVVGGMITKNDLTEERKVPWLGDLPVIGKAFRYDAFNHNRTELLIFLTPRIVHNDGDMEMIKQVEASRLHFFQDDVESVHGPIFGTPDSMTLPIGNSPALDLLPVEPVEIPGEVPAVPPAHLPPPATTPDLIQPMSARSIEEPPKRGIRRLGGK